MTTDTNLEKLEGYLGGGRTLAVQYVVQTQLQVDWLQGRVTQPLVA